MYKLRDGEWGYDRWLKVYEQNWPKAKAASEAVTGYQKKLGRGRPEQTVMAGGETRRLDIADIKTRRGVEVKEYGNGHITATEDVRWEVERGSLMIATRDEFEYWRFHFEDVMQEFEAFVPEALAAGLDRSVESLDALESWLLERHDGPDAILKLDQRPVLDGASRYVGETYAACLDGKWQINVEDTDDAFYGLPVVSYVNGSDCPLTIVTAALDRRSGTYMSKILKNKISRL